VTVTDRALADLGVAADVLPASAYETLDVNGFVALPGVIDGPWLADIRDRLDELYRAEHDQALGADLLTDLVNRGEVFERMLREPRVLAAARHVLGDFKVNSLNARSSRPGDGAQHLHSDCGPPRADGTFKICNSIWLIDDFTDRNGATRAVPATHRERRQPADVMHDVFAAHPDEVQLTGAAGTVIVFNGHLWHGGTRNRTGSPRRGITLSFCRRDEAQQLNQAQHIRPAVRDRLSPAERYLLDV
jgi:phytanoyl-CoA dioxygenase PhyH